jgi:hypothetical protein
VQKVNCTLFDYAAGRRIPVSAAAIVGKTSIRCKTKASPAADLLPDSLFNLHID